MGGGVALFLSRCPPNSTNWLQHPELAILPYHVMLIKLLGQQISELLCFHRALRLLSNLYTEVLSMNV